MPPKLVPLGKNGPVIPALGFGLMGMSLPVYGSANSDEEAFALLDRAVELGATNWDTSDLYGNSETLVGRWLKRTGKRDQLFLASKFGYIKGSKSYEKDSSGEFCKKACAESIKQLGTHIDLYYMHSANPKTPIEETMRAMVELQKEGNIRYIGLSSISSATLRRAVKIAPVTAVQTEYSPFTLDIESAKGTDLLATCRKLGVAVVCSSPLGRGLLTSTFASGEAQNEGPDHRWQVFPRFQEANRAANMKLVSQFKDLAETKGCTTTQLALAWLLKQGDDIIPIPGTKKIKYLEENWASLDVQLSDEDEKEIREFVQKAEIVGGFMPPAFEDQAFKDTVEEAE